MEKANKIFNHEKFKAALESTAECEKDRIYCLHGFEHAMDVARIAYILVLEGKLNIEKDTVYCAALLHDLGRYKQYAQGIPHTLAGAEIAREIMSDCGFDEEFQEEILGVILYHGTPKNQSPLGEVLNKADALSRMCLNCKARPTCKWEKNEMNMEIDY